MPSSVTCHRKPPPLPGAGSVALADILANGVAVILILIIVTLSVQQQQAQEELEKSTDITTILARQLSSTLVYNDLPSSPPARLHDYNSCAIEHDCNLMLYPIIEMHNGHIRIFNTNTRIYRRELLNENNALDRYLHTLTIKQRNHIRLDIHAISEYYLTMGILQEHNIKVRHWHYLGENIPPLNSHVLAQSNDPSGIENREENRDRTAKPGTGHPDNDEQTASHLFASQILQTTQQADAQTLDTLQYTTLLPPASDDGTQSIRGNTSWPFTALHENGQQNAKKDLKPSTLFETLVRILGNGTSPATGNNQHGQVMRLSVPNAGLLPPGDKNTRLIALPPRQYRRVIITYLLKLLEIARIEKTLQLSSARQWLAYYALNPRHVEGFPHRDLVDRLDADLDKLTGPKYPPLTNTRVHPKTQQNQLQLEINKVLPATTLQLHQATPWLETLNQTQQVQPSFLLRLYPSLFKGERLDVPKSYTVLIHPGESDHPDKQWRPIAIIDAKLNDISLGFVHAGLNQNQLLLSAGVNQLHLNRIPVANPLLSAQNDNQIRLAWVWLLTLAGLMLLLARYRFGTRAQNQ